MKNSAAVKLQTSFKTPALIQSHRILIVDDEKEILQAYRDILTPAASVAVLKSSRGKAQTEVQAISPFTIVTVSNGEDAVEHVKKAVAEGQPFAMGFFDVLLNAGIDGIETVKQIHQIDPQMYAVLVTAYQDRHVNSIQQVFGVEFEDRWDYLNKPFSSGEILQKARSMVSMWNIRQKHIAQQNHLDEMKSQLSANEKSLTVAAVARSVGHEFGNILLQIMGRADLSRNGAAEEMKKALETILVASEHAGQVLQRFKNLSNPKKESREKQPLDIALPIKDTLMMMEHELKRKAVKVKLNIDGLPPVLGDHSALVQVFMNLVINAVHAIESDGEIEFEGKVFERNLQITVRDSGAGIKPEHVDSVFEAFFTTKGSFGTGLGLCVCKEVIEISHGGSITVSNHPKGGAEFKILIPLSGDGEVL